MIKLFCAATLMIVAFGINAEAQRGSHRQPFVYKARAITTCEEARNHHHDDIITRTMYVVSWDGCTMKGVIRGGKFNGRVYTVFGGFDGDLKPHANQKIVVRYDRSCGQVMWAMFPDTPFDK